MNELDDVRRRHAAKVVAKDRFRRPAAALGQLLPEIVDVADIVERAKDTGDGASPTRIADVLLAFIDLLEVGPADARAHETRRLETSAGCGAALAVTCSGRSIMWALSKWAKFPVRTLTAATLKRIPGC